MMTEYYTPKEMAEIFRMKVSDIYYLLKKGRIRYIKHKGRIYIDSVTVRLFMMVAKDMIQKMFIIQQQKLNTKKILEEIKNAVKNSTEAKESQKD